MKAELLNKQNQAKQTLSDGSRTIKRLKTKPKAAIQNKGVTSRAQQDELNREDIEEPSLEKVKYFTNIIKTTIDTYHVFYHLCSLSLHYKKKQNYMKSSRKTKIF